MGKDLRVRIGNSPTEVEKSEDIDILSVGRHLTPMSTLLDGEIYEFTEFLSAFKQAGEDKDVDTLLILSSVLVEVNKMWDEPKFISISYD